MKNIKYKANFYSLLFVMMFLSTGCEKFVQIEAPKTQIVTETVFSNDETAKSAMAGVYSEMVNGSGFASGGFSSIAHLTGLSSDEFINYSASQDISGFYTMSLLPTNGTIRSSLWQPAYKYIYYVNAIIEAVESSNSITSFTKNQLTGEALFLRAFYYFYLVNTFGDVPLIITTDYRTNATTKRSSQSAVYNQIIVDLKEAQRLLPSDFSISGGERVRPCKDAATALLSRVFLYTKNWQGAESESSSLISNSSVYKLSDLKDVFLANSKEAIWQLRPVASGLNTKEGQFFILNTTPTTISLNIELVNSFESGDQRKTQWINSFSKDQKTYFYPFKYKVSGTGQVLSEYSMILRLAEQYLIRAEARLRLHDIIGSLADINIIRYRAGLSPIVQATEVEMANIINHERRVELFSEWGHRWFDLKRSENVSAVMSQIKGTSWQIRDLLYPIPQNEINNNQNITQNTGYN